MSEILLQTIIEKLHALEAKIIKQDDTVKIETIPETFNQQLNALQTDIKVLLNSNGISERKLEKLLAAVEIKNERVHTVVEHKHHLHKGIWAAVGLFIFQ